MSRKHIYFDHSATTPVRPEVVEEMIKYYTDNYGNPSSQHSLGQFNRDVVESSRNKMADLLGVNPKTLYFTSGGSEADNLAIKGIAFRNLDKKGHIITSAIEHKAVLETVKYLENLGFEATYLGVNEQGLVSPEELRKAIREDTLVISIMYANNEVGTVQPIDELSAIACEKDIPIHSDAVQAIGKVNFDFEECGLNMIAASAHKFYGPKGSGFLYMDDKTRRKSSPLIHGGSHERSFRAGTENVAGIVGMAKALELVLSEMEETNKYLIELEKYLLDGIRSKISGVHFNGHPDKKLPGFLNLSFERIEGEGMLLSLDMNGIYASSGSACTSQSLEPSHVLKAMNCDIVLAHGSIRFTLGKNNTKADIDHFLEVFPPVVERLREISVL